MLVTALVGVPASPAYAAATCRGQTATHTANGGTLETTAGPDVVVVEGTNTRVLAGDGNDVICVIGGAGTISVDAGGGADTVDTTAAATVTDTVLGPGPDIFVGGGQTDTVRSAEDPATDAIATGAGRDSVTAYDGGALFVDLGPGADLMSFNTAEGAPASALDLGAGHDTLILRDTVDLTVDLAEETFEWYAVQSSVRHVEEVLAAGDQVVLRGDRHANDLRAIGCRVAMNGGAGKDDLAHIANTDLPLPPCRKRRAHLVGRGGADSLRGFSGNDVLLGGRGRDVAYGAGGRDRCLAEKQETCER